MHGVAYLEFYLFKGRGRRSKSSRLSCAILEVLRQPGSQEKGRGLGERKEGGVEEKKQISTRSINLGKRGLHIVRTRRNLV